MSTIFCIPCSDGLPKICSITFWVSFFIMPRAPITTGIVLILNFYIFVTSISRSLYLESFWNSLREIFLSAGTVTSIMIHVFSSKLFIVMSGWLASIFQSVLIVKSHRIVTSVPSVTGCGVCSYHFPVCGKLKFLHNIQWMKQVSRSCLWRYSILTIVGHVNTIWSTISSLCVFSLQLGSAPLLRIFDWDAPVDILWSWAVIIKPSVSHFKLELLIHWWAVALSTLALSVLKGYFPCSGFSFHLFFEFSKLVFCGFFIYILSCFCWNLNFLVSITIYFVLSFCAVKQLETSYLLKTGSNYLSQLSLFYKPFLNSSFLIPFLSNHICLEVMHSVEGNQFSDFSILSISSKFQLLMASNLFLAFSFECRTPPTRLEHSYFLIHFSMLNSITFLYTEVFIHFFLIQFLNFHVRI